MAAVIFKGSAVKTLKDKIIIGVAEQIQIITNQSADPTVTPIDAPIGSLYFRAGTNEVYIKQDAGSSTNWSKQLTQADPTVSGPGSSTDEALARFDGTTGKTLQNSNATLTDAGALTVTDTIKARSQTIELGTADAFARRQIWNKDTNAIIRAGAWTADGDSSNVSSEGAAFYGPSITGTNPTGNVDGGYARIKHNRFALYTLDASIALSGDWYRVDPTEIFYKNNSDTKTFTVNRATGNITTIGTVDGRDVSVDGSTLDGHLDGGASKHDATEVDYERADGAKKNIQVASDDVETALTDLDDAVGALASSPSNYTPGDSTIVASHLSAIDTALGALAPAGPGEWANSVIDKDLTAPPGGESVGDRYLIGLDTLASVATGAWATHDGELAQWNGASWDFTVPTVGTFVGADDETTGLYLFGGTTWTFREFEATTASTGLTKVGVDVRLDISSAGDGLGFAAGVLSVNTDDVGIEKSGDTLQLKDGGITNAKVNTSAAIAHTKMAALTVSRAMVTDGSGFSSASAVTATELGYVSGVTSAIQSQIDGKQNDVITTQGDIVLGNVSGQEARLGIGAVDTMLKSDGSTLAYGKIVDANVDAAAAVSVAKLSLGATDTVLTSSGATNSFAKIVNANVDAAAAVAHTKMAALTVSRAMVTDGSGFSSASAVTATELGYVSGVTSAIQTQLDTKLSSIVDVVSINSNTNGINKKTYLVQSDVTTIQVTLPTPAANVFVRIKDSGFNANVNNITIARNGSEKIEGVAATYTMNSAGDMKTFVSDGTDWFII